MSTSQTGNYFIQNYTPKHYKSGANNFGITQNNEGLIFIANDNGVLIYDGLNWELCRHPEEITISCIGKTSEGLIVVGTGDGDIAKIVRNKIGHFVYVSLFDTSNLKHRPQETVRQIINLSSCTYFLSADKLVEYKNSRINSYNPIENFHSRAFVMGQHLFVTEMGHHISVLINNKLIPVQHTEELSNEKSFYCYPLSAFKYALGYRNIGTFLASYDSAHPERSSFEEHPSACDVELISAETNNGYLLRNGHYIVTSNKGGAYELDQDLNITARFNSRTGINDDNVKSVFQDENGNIWLALYYGISFVEINSRLFNYTRSNGLSGLIQSACYFEGKLFIATDKGVMVYDKNQEKFVPFLDFNKQSWYLYAHENKLFIGTAKGMFIYSEDHLQQVSESNTFCFLVNPYIKGVLYAGTSDGIEMYRILSHTAQLIREVSLNSAVKSIATDFNRNTYFATEDKGIFFFNHSKSYAWDSIQEKEGLPHQNFENFVFNYHNKLLIGTDSGIYTVRKNSDLRYLCIKDPQFWPLTQGALVFRASQMGNDLVCSQKYILEGKNKTEERITLFEQVGNTTKANTEALNRLIDVTANSITFDSTQKSVLISANEGLYILKQDTTHQNKHYNLILKRISSRTDTLLENMSSLDTLSKFDIEIPYQNHDLNVLLGFTSFESVSYEFSSMLEGHDDAYSPWSKEQEFSFNNLSEGKYKLKVRAKSELEDKIHELVLPFRILPPWYRSVIAYIVYGVLFVAFIILLVRFNSRRLIAVNKKLEQTVAERTKTISHQKEELEHKQKEIIDSINYAQRIQRALLASEKLLEENLNDYFLLFKPKDIVSGDFYWATPTPEGFLYITADCTGHGVPGAFMSLLNISKLNETVNQKHIFSPNLVLNEVRDEIIHALNPAGSKEESKDGMDAVLCKFDRNGMKLQFAAANNSFYIIRNREILVCKADKMPVGKGHDNTPFTFSEIELQKGDLIYTFTDGYADQFGGPKGKKFKYKQMEEIMLSVAELPMPEQKQILNDRFEEWRGELEQVDDVCIIGLRV